MTAVISTKNSVELSAVDDEECNRPQQLNRANCLANPLITQSSPSVTTNFTLTVLSCLSG